MQLRALPLPGALLECPELPPLLQPPMCESGQHPAHATVTPTYLPSLPCHGILPIANEVLSAWAGGLWLPPNPLLSLSTKMPLIL